MRGNTNRSAGLGADDGGSPSNNPERAGWLDRARDHVSSAQASLRYCNRQEAIEAQDHLANAEKCLDAALACEGERGGEGVGRKDEAAS